MWPFKRKYIVKEGRRYCPECGKRISLSDHAHSTEQRVFCKTCNRFVWITQDWAFVKVEGRMTEERLEAHEWLIRREKEKREEIKNTPKDLKIHHKFCSFCGTPIEHTYRNKIVPTIIQFELQCPNCGDIRFYEDVEALNAQPA